MATSGLQFLRVAILTRLLTPEDFGLMGMMVVVLGLAQAFSDMGLSNAIIHRQDTTRGQLSSLYWANWIAGLLTFAALCGLAPFIAIFYHEPRLDHLMMWAAAAFLIGPVGQQFRVLLQRELHFRALATIEVSAAAFATAVAVVLAAAGAGVYSLVFSQLAGNAVEATCLAVIGWRRWTPRLHFDRGELRGFLSFGTYQMAERSINYLTANLGYLIIGRVLGSEALGPYYVASQLIITPLIRINPIVTRVAFPVFSRKQRDNGTLVQGYLEITHFLALIVIPVLVGLAAAAPVLVPVLLGAQWSGATPLIEVLAFVGVLRAVGNPIGSILLAKGRADIGFWWNAVVAVLTGAIFMAVVEHGTLAIALGYLAICVLNMIVLLVLLDRLLGLGWKQYLASMRGPAIAALLMGVIVRGTSAPVAEWLSPISLAAASLVLLGAIVYASAIVGLEGPYLRRLGVTLLNH